MRISVCFVNFSAPPHSPSNRSDDDGADHDVTGSAEDQGLMEGGEGDGAREPEEAGEGVEG